MLRVGQLQRRQTLKDAVIEIKLQCIKPRQEFPGGYAAVPAGRKASAGSIAAQGARRAGAGARASQRASMGCSSVKNWAETRTRAVSIPQGAGAGKGAAAVNGCILFSKRRVKQVSSRFSDLQRINLLI